MPTHWWYPPLILGINDVRHRPQDISFTVTDIAIIQKDSKKHAYSHCILYIKPNYCWLTLILIFEIVIRAGLEGLTLYNGLINTL